MNLVMNLITLKIRLCFNNNNSNDNNNNKNNNNNNNNNNKSLTVHAPILAMHY